MTLIEQLAENLLSQIDAAKRELCEFKQEIREAMADWWIDRSETDGGIEDRDDGGKFCDEARVILHMRNVITRHFQETTNIKKED